MGHADLKKLAQGSAEMAHSGLLETQPPFLMSQGGQPQHVSCVFARDHELVGGGVGAGRKGKGDSLIMFVSLEPWVLFW